MTITGKVRVPSWKRKKQKRKARKAKVTIPSTARIMSARKEKWKLDRNHLDTFGDVLAKHAETNPLTRPLAEQWKALARNRYRLQKKIANVLTNSDTGKRKNVGNGGIVKSDDGRRLKYSTLHQLDGREVNLRIVDSKPAPLSDDDQIKLQKLQEYLQRTEFNLWKIEEQFNGQFNRETVPRPRKYQPDPGKTIFDRAVGETNNWRKRFNAREIARILYKEGVDFAGEKNFRKAQTDYDALSDDDKALVIKFRDEYLAKHGAAQ